MKESDVKEYETGNHCYGEILWVNGKEYADIDKQEKIELLLDMFENNHNSELLLREVFSLALAYIEAELVEDTNDKCDQCGDWNTYSKFKSV